MRFLVLLMAAIGALGAQYPIIGWNPRPEVTRPATVGAAFFSLSASGIYPFAVAADSSGNLYIAGTVQSNIFAATAGSVQTQYAGGTCINADPHQAQTYPCSDVFVLKLDPTGAIVYATYLGGSGNDFASSIAADAEGNLYVTGGTTSGDFPVTTHALFPKSSGQGIDGFVAKISPAGDHLEYSTFLPGVTATALAVDSKCNAYLATTVFAALSTFPTTPGAYQPKSSSAGSTGLIAKISADGSALLYSTFLGGTSSIGSGDSALGIAVDAAGNAYVTGSTSSSNFPVTPGVFQSHIGGQFPTAFVAELSSDGSRLVYSTFLGGTVLDSGNQIKVDGRGSAYVLGTTSSKDFPITPGAFQSTIAGAPWSPGDLGAPFVAKLSVDGTALEYATYFSGATALDVDSNGNAFILGQAAGFPVTSGAFQRCMNGGGVDLFAAQLTAGGKLAGATYLGGSGSESPVGIAAASDGPPWVAGTTTSTDFPGLIGDVHTQPLLIAEKLAINDTAKHNGPCIALAIQNGANFIEGPIAPGELVTIRGSGIGPDTPAYQLIGPDGKLTTQLAGVQVLMNGVPAPLLYVQSQQINVQVPWETTGFETMPFPSSPVSVDVIYNGAATNSISIPAVSASPAVFYLDFTTLDPAVLNSDNTVNTFQNPAARGSAISIYATGGGILAPGGVDGGLWPRSPLSVLTAPASVLIGGLSAEVLYAGSAPGLLSGVLQINARVPEQLPAPEVVVLDVTVQIGNARSWPVYIAIK